MALQTDLTDLFEYGTDFKNRRIYFGCTADDGDMATDFNKVTIEFAIRALHRMVAENPNKPIELHVNSEGGHPYDMIRLLDEILSCPTQVKFYGGGSVMSSATWIMCACDERYLYPNTTVMCHDGSEALEGKHTDIQIDAQEAKRLQDLLYDLYEKNSILGKGFWQDICTRNLYLTAHEAVSLGLADKVVEPKKRGNLRKVRQTSMKKSAANPELPQLIKDLYSRVKIPQSTTVIINRPKPEAVDPHVIIDDRPVEVTKEPQQPIAAEALPKE